MTAAAKRARAPGSSETEGGSIDTVITGRGATETAVDAVLAGFA